ncbi:MAG: carbon-nitrogen hydrolase [Deferrisomatales bacterium]
MVKVAAIQVSASRDLDRNLRKAGQYLEVAAQRGVRIACFPELFGLPWFPSEPRPEAFEWAQPLGGRLEEALSQAAARLGIAVVAPFFERAGDGVFYNSALVLDSKGARVGLYRKVHVPRIPLWEEKYYFAPGDRGFGVFQVDGVRLGIQLGWDHFFPEGFRCLALGGAQIVFVPTAAAFASQERWLAMSVSHAVANGIFVVRVNRVGGEPGLDFYGGSFVVQPDGELAADPIGLDEGMLTVECEVAQVERARQTWPFLKDRRPRQYAAVAGVAWGPHLLPPEADGDAEPASEAT